METGPAADRVLFIVALAIVLGGCAAPNPNRCGQGEEFVVHDTLNFGTAKPNGIVTPEEWQEFLKTTVTPRFPRGFATMASAGQWRGADGATVQEASHVLVLDHPNDTASDNAVREIISTYKSRFQQEAVFRVKTEACISF